MKQLTRRTKLYISLGVVISIIVVSLSIVGYGIYQVYYDPAALFKRNFDEVGDVEQYFGERVINVAVLGLHYGNRDSQKNGIYNVDTILVASLNFDQDCLSLISIPRDAYVEIAHLGIKDTISSAYKHGYQQSRRDKQNSGLHTTVDTISNIMGGIKIHYFIAMDMIGLMQLIDSMGGVHFYVDTPIIGPSEEESLYVGPQTLDGRGYLTYLTYRDPEAQDDLERIERQKTLLVATFEHFQDMGRFRLVLPTYAAYRDHVPDKLAF